MAKKKKLVKKAIKHPEDYTRAEIQYFQLWLRHKKEKKADKLAVNSASYSDVTD